MNFLAHNDGKHGGTIRGLDGGGVGTGKRWWGSSRSGFGGTRIFVYIHIQAAKIVSKKVLVVIADGTVDLEWMEVSIGGPECTGCGADRMKL